jgi:phage regulator Rha-like protein
VPDDTELQDIDSELLRATETNAKAGKWIEYQKKIDNKAAKEKEIEANKTKQDKCKAESVEYIKQFSFPFAGLSTDESGGLILNDRPLNESYFSRGELEIIVAQLHASLNPEFKVRFIDDFDLIDDANQEKILKTLDEKGFQVITAEVRKTKERENTLILRECEIVNEENEGKEKLL